MTEPNWPTEADMNDLADDLLGIVLPEGFGARLITRALELWGRPALAQPELVKTPMPIRPDCFEFAMDFLGDPEEAELRNYIEALEARQLAQPEPEGHQAIAKRAIESCLAQREEVLAAFIAKHGFQPEDAIQVEQSQPDGTSTWRIERRTKPHPELEHRPVYSEDFWRRDALEKLVHAATSFRLGVYSAEELEIYENRARAVLARWGRPAIQPVPEPEGPSDEELRDLWSWSAAQDQGPWPTQQHCFARALLARFGRPAIEPVPVGERLPEPGVKVLAHYFNSHGKSRTVCARWIPAKFESRDPETDDLLEYDEDSDTFYWPEGWYEEIENWDDYQCVTINEGEVTHWQPLPHWALPVPTSEPEVKP